MKVLVIDDDAQVRGYIALVLQRAGYDVSVAADGAEGLRMNQELSPDIVISDIFMPGKDGLEVLREVKAEPHGPTLIAISGGSPRVPGDYLNVARNFGADAVLQKPFSPDKILEAISDCIAAAA